MRTLLWGMVFAACAATPVFAADSCANVTGDVVLSARTPQVDLYDGANGKVVSTLDRDKLPSCTPVTARAPNMMLKVSVNGTDYWVPPHMVNARLAGKGTCRLTPQKISRWAKTRRRWDRRAASAKTARRRRRPDNDAPHIARERGLRLRNARRCFGRC